MKIAIIGGGYVGLYTALRLTEIKKEIKIDIIDIDENKINKFNRGESPIDDFFMNKFMKDNPSKIENISYKNVVTEKDNYDIYFIALSTNPLNDEESRLNTNEIFKIAKKIKNNNPESSVIIRSTLNIDDSNKIDELKLNYWPEFLAQGVIAENNIKQKINVLSLSEEDYNASKFFDEIFKNKIVLNVKAKEAIFIKVMHNSLDAYLITLTNLFANISEENDIDFHSISSFVELLLQNRPKIKKPGIGFGGSCYPKDSYSLLKLTNLDRNINLLNSLNDFNKEQSSAFLTKIEIIKKASNIIVLGSSFKGGTNDVVKTPTLFLRKWLMENGISYKIWEPMISQEWLINNEIISKNIKEDINKSDLVIVASDWNEFNELLKNYEFDVIDLKSFIIDNGKMKLHKVGKK